MKKNFCLTYAYLRNQSNLITFFTWDKLKTGNTNFLPHWIDYKQLSDWKMTGKSLQQKSKTEFVKT